MAVALLTAAVSLVAHGLGGSMTTDWPAMRARLTNDGCTYDGDTSPTAGMFTIEVENQTEFSGSFVLLSLAEGSTVDDLQPALDQYPRQFERDGTHSGAAGLHSSWSAPTSRQERPVRCLPTSPPAHTPSCALSTTTFPPSRSTSRSSWT